MVQNNFLNGDITPRCYLGRYVVMPHEVDYIHDLVPGTTAKRFEENKSLLENGEDYYISKRPIYGVKGRPIYLTASGYLKLTDDKNMQGKMFNYYFSGMLKTDNGVFWQIEINELVKHIKESSGLEKLKILSLAYNELSNKYGIDLNKQKRVYLKKHKDLENISVMEVVHWLERTGELPEKSLKLCLEKISDEFDLGKEQYVTDTK